MPYKDPDKQRQYQREWKAAKKAADPEAFLDARRRWNSENPDAKRAYDRKWRENNPLSKRRTDLMYKARKRLESLIQQAEEMYD